MVSSFPHEHSPEQEQHFIVALVEEILARATEAGASDIHLEPLPKRLRVRFRCDGILREVQSLPQQWQAPLLSRLKIMTTTMNIAEKRLPQEGRFELEQHGFDVRVATMPTSHGESMTLRLLNPAAFSKGLSELGLDSNDLETLQQLLQRPDGLILITGPTGSGKTTTLYTCLQTLAAQGAKVMTIEDPVEYRIPGVNQVQVHEEIGLTFSHALRSLLRQATNKIMVGEIRDATTLESVLQASLTGHLVFSTLHTHDAPSAVVRLKNMGACTASLATSLRAIIAQRLVRRCCEACSGYRLQTAGYRKNTFAPSQQLFFSSEAHSTQTQTSSVEQSCTAVEVTAFKKKPNCFHCGNTGLRGRIGLFEVLVLDESLRYHLHHTSNLEEWTLLAQHRRSKSLREDGIMKTEAGLTTMDEIFKVTQT